MYQQPSSQLASQTISKRAIADLLIWLGRTQWQENYNAHDLVIEAWAAGIWVKQAGLISYRTLAKWLKTLAQLKAYQLSVQKKGDRLYLVQGSQQPWYAVVNRGEHYSCECMLYRCRYNRVKKEMPKLYQSLQQQIFCHHTEAARMVA